jgi:hypothetical protein
VTGFDIYDRYDFLASLLIGVVAIGAFLVGAPVWAAALIVIAGCTGMFIRHFDEFMRS